MKAVIYARYSSDNQREESIEGQIRECTAFAEKNDITLSGEKLRKYFPRSYTPFQIENTIFKLLDAWQKKRQRDQSR